MSPNVGFGESRIPIPEEKKQLLSPEKFGQIIFNTIWMKSGLQCSRLVLPHTIMHIELIPAVPPKFV